MTHLEEGEKAGDGEVTGEMQAGPPSTAAMAVAVVAVTAVEGGGELKATLLGEG